MIIQWALGPWRSHESRLFQTLWDAFTPGDVLVGDRGFSTWGLWAQCLRRRMDAVFRVRGKLRSDFRRGRRLSKNERLVIWSKSLRRPRTIRRREWKKLPDQLTLRLIRCILDVPGFRTRKVTIVTTLLDRQRFPAAANLGRSNDDRNLIHSL